MKNLLILVMCLISLKSLAMIDEKHYYLNYEFEDQKYTFTSADKDYYKALRDGAEACMKYYKADVNDQERYLDLIDTCANPR